MQSGSYVLLHICRERFHSTEISGLNVSVSVRLFSVYVCVCACACACARVCVCVWCVLVYIYPVCVCDIVLFVQALSGRSVSVATTQMKLTSSMGVSYEECKDRPVVAVSL